MNGPHDLGGRHCLGPINPELEGEEPVFHEAWERRVFGLNLAAGSLGKWNIDMSRYARERQHPVDYLQNSYYENWLVGLERLLVESGLVTAEELANGKADMPLHESAPRAVLAAEDVPEVLTRGSPTTMTIETPPKYQPGEQVRAVNRHPIGHTREPGYVRGRVGVITAHEGGHVYPDRNAERSREARHLYNVRFESSELWGEDANGHYAVYVDLWEDYLEPA